MRFPNQNTIVTTNPYNNGVLSLYDRIAFIQQIVYGSRKDAEADGISSPSRVLKPPAASDARLVVPIQISGSRP